MAGWAGERLMIGNEYQWATQEAPRMSLTEPRGKSLLIKGLYNQITKGLT